MDSYKLQLKGFDSEFETILPGDTNIEEMYNAFERALLAMGYHPESIKRYLTEYSE